MGSIRKHRAGGEGLGVCSQDPFLGAADGGDPGTATAQGQPPHPHHFGSSVPAWWMDWGGDPFLLTAPRPPCSLHWELEDIC